MEVENCILNVYDANTQQSFNINSLFSMKNFTQNFPDTFMYLFSEQVLLTFKRQENHTFKSILIDNLILLPVKLNASD